VNQVISGSREVLIWDFCHAVLEGEAKPALAQLSALLAQDESEVGILVLLAGQVRLAALAAVLRENKMLRLSRGSFASAEVSPEGQAYLPRKKSGEPISTYALGQAAQRSQHRPARFWFRALALIFRTQKEMLTGESDKRRALELLVLEIVAG
jgi:DNA polymerase-3 subunit delta